MRSFFSGEEAARMRGASLGKDLAWVVTGRLVGALGLLAVTAILSRSLTPAEYGEFFLLVSLVAVAVTVATVGQHQIVVRELGRNAGSSHRQVVVQSIVIVALASAAMGGLIGALRRPAAVWIDLPHLHALGWMVGLWVLIAALVRVAGEAVRGLRMIALASFLNGQSVTGSAATLIFLVLALALPAMRGNVDLALVVGSVAVALGVSLVCLIVGLTLYQGRGGQRKLSLRASLLAGLPILGGGLVSIASLQGDLWIVHAVLETDQVALFGAVRTLANLGLMPLAVVSAALFPRIAGAYFSGRKSQLERLSRVSSSVAGLLATVVLVPAFVLPELLLSVVFGSYYADGATALRLLAAGSLLNLCSGPWGMVLLQTGHQRVFFAIGLLGASTGLLLAFWLARGWGVEGVAAAWLVGQAVLAGAGTLALRERIGIWAFPSFSLRAISRTLRAHS